MRKLVIGILCVTALLLLGYSGYRSYRIWKQNHLMSMARHFAAESDLPNARLSLLELLRVNSRNIEASRLMADLAETDQSPVALSWRKRVVELNPHSSNDRLAFAAIAIKLRDLTSAANALAGIPEADKHTAAYHNIAGSLEAAANRFAAAEAHFLEAVQLEPQNHAPELSLAVLRLHDTNAAGMAEARNTLSRLGSNPTNSTLRCQAIRELTIDAIHHHQKDASLALSKRLAQETNSLFTDRLLRLEALWETRNEGFKMEQTSLQREAQSDPAKIQELIMWQLGKIPPGESLAWLRSLPMSTQTNHLVAQLKAECCVALQDWPGLQACVEKGDWGELESVRHAFETRALRGQGLNDAAEGEWRQAVQAANGQVASLVMLMRLAAQWNWVSEGEDILWTIVNGHPNEQWARQALARALFASGQTRSLMQLYSQQATRFPSDLVAKNNVAMTALLLNAQELKPHQLALELYHEAPTNSSFAATYAFSLYQQGKKTEALKVLDRLDPREIETATVAPCYGILLEATGNRLKAKRYLDLASKFQMLPEERKLIDSAKRDLDHAGTPKS
jgi:tetratricopeptide (TPR) repeat protein